MKMYIELKDLATIIAGLVKEGIMFEVRPQEHGDGCYIVELTGGY